MENRQAVSIPEVTAHGISDIEIIDGLFHCVLYTVRDTHTGTPWREPLIRVAMPVANVPKCVEQVIGALASGAVFTMVETVKRLTH